MGIKYKVNENFFDRWNAIMAYVLGYWYADGSMYFSARGSYINVTSIDKDTIYKIKKWLDSHHTIREAEPIWSNGKIRYTLRIGNKSLYKSLLKLGLYPSKSLSIQLPNVPNKFLNHFVRGYFDGDGCVYIYIKKGKTQERILGGLTTTFTSGSKMFLDSLCQRLKFRLELNRDKVYKGHRSFQLKYNTADSMKIFNFMYLGCQPDLYLKRKFEIFKHYFSLSKKYGAVAK